MDRRACRGRAQTETPAPCPAERVAEGAAEDLVHQRLFQEPDLRFRRVDVHVHAIRRDPQEQVHLRAALLDRRDAVGLDDRVRDRPVLDDAAVDEDVLGAAGRALVAERGHVAFDLQAAGLLPDLDQVGALAEQLEEPLAQAVDGRALQQAASAAADGEPTSG